MYQNNYLWFRSWLPSSWRHSREIFVRFWSYPRIVEDRRLQGWCGCGCCSLRLETTGQYNSMCIFLLRIAPKFAHTHARIQPFSQVYWNHVTSTSPTQFERLSNCTKTRTKRVWSSCAIVWVARSVIICWTLRLALMGRRGSMSKWHEWLIVPCDWFRYWIGISACISVRHVAIYLPVGAPHIGAQSSVHATMEGSIPPGLEAFLDKEEGLMLARSFGSLPWLYPLESVAPLPQSVTAKTGLHPSGKKRGLHRVGKLLIAAYRMGSAMSSPQSATAESTLHQPPTMPTAWVRPRGFECFDGILIGDILSSLYFIHLWCASLDFSSCCITTRIWHDSSVLRDESSLRIIFPNQVLHLGNFFRECNYDAAIQ